MAIYEWRNVAADATDRSERIELLERQLEQAAANWYMAHMYLDLAGELDDMKQMKKYTDKAFAYRKFAREQYRKAIEELHAALNS